MKALLFMFLFTGLAISNADESLPEHFHLEAEEDGSSVLSPKEEKTYFENLKGLKAVFAQTKWKECTDPVTGNYVGLNCSSNRGISVILDDFLQSNFLRCANEGLASIGLSNAVDMHVKHDGIQGDANHSSRSLHAEARAVDVSSVVMFFANGAQKEFVFNGSQDINFFNSFRSCWGKTIHHGNGCPLISGSYRLTASIGKEDSHHQHHVHVSVPYCVNGQYAGKYFKR